VVGAEREAIWLCLVCAHVGCGRNLSGHAAVHFELTKHRYCIELRQHYVWDYHADGFVHRVHGRDNATAAASTTASTATHSGQSDPSAASSRFARGEYDSDAELDEAEAEEEEGEWLDTDDGREGQSHSPTEYGEEDDGLLHGKLASITSHYSHLLQSELGKQADFFEQLIADKHSALESSNAQHTRQLATMQHSIVGLQSEVDGVQQAVRQCRVQLAERRRRNGSQRDENGFIKQINASLINDQQQQASASGGGSVSAAVVASSPRTVSSLAGKQRRISGLQSDIARLMARLDNQHSGPTSSRERAAR